MQARAPTSVRARTRTRTHTRTLAWAWTRQGQAKPARVGYDDSDNKEAKGSCPAAPQVRRQGCSVCLRDSEAPECLVRLAGVFTGSQTLLEGGKKERERSNFSSPQLPWVCATG